MEEIPIPDFSGYATKAGIRCTDGRVITPQAFKGQGGTRVPLVWQHSHGDPTNVLGHAILEARSDGMYAYGFLNETPRGSHAREMIKHGDVTRLSIWANEIMERGNSVLHGVIREVSLVMAGANPGAVIDNVTISHSDEDGETYETVLDDEVIIHSGVDLVCGDLIIDENGDVIHAADSVEDTNQKQGDGMATKDATDEGPTIGEIYDNMTDEQKEVLHFMVGKAIEDALAEASVEHAQEIEGIYMNVFEGTDNGGNDRVVISHDDMKAIITDANRRGSLRDAVSDYALSHGIENIDLLFPDAKELNDSIDVLARRSEWVANIMGKAHKSPFSRIRTTHADLTYDQARAKGYVTGAVKREEFFGLIQRVTTPTTVYKKQKLERDDVLDISSMDIVAWLKAEMRLMLDEEIARAMLVGDGRDISDPDKISELHIRPVANDHELYTSKVYVNVNGVGGTAMDIVDAVIQNRSKYRGTGTPSFYTSENTIASFLLLKDSLGRRMYRTLDELKNELRVAEIIPVEVLGEYPDILGIMFNPIDYNFGTDRGGQVTMFDDFDIDYNKHKYLIEGRTSGALTRLKSAIVVLATDAASVEVTPVAPTFDPENGELTIPTVTGVVYRNSLGVVIDSAGSPYTVPSGQSYRVDATPGSGYNFATSDDDTWVFTAY